MPSCPSEQRFGREQFMNDFIFVSVMTGFFVIAAFYAHYCGKL
jgi:hypothetical protein